MKEVKVKKKKVAEGKFVSRIAAEMVIKSGP